MRQLLRKSVFIEALVIILCFYGYISGCTHDDEGISSSGPDIQRGTDTVSVGAAPFDKAHSNVNWATAYQGAVSNLTGRFDQFEILSFKFDEANAANTAFEARVRLNSVNTSEPARDDGCLLGTFGTDADNTTEPENLGIVKTKSVALSTSDAGYVVTFDFTFHGATKELTGKLNYDGKTSDGKTYGFNFQFSFLAKTDFGIASSSIADNCDVSCNAVFKRP